jgi:hypothetical protein
MILQHNMFNTHMSKVNYKLITSNLLYMMGLAYLLWCLLTLHIMLMLLMIPYDPITLSHRLCEMVHKDI